MCTVCKLAIPLLAMFFFQCHMPAASGPFDRDKFLSLEGSILDVRTEQEYSAGHLAGSINIPVHELPNKLDKLEKDKPVLVYCASGNRSSTAVQILKDSGFTVVYDARTRQQAEKLLQKP